MRTLVTGVAGFIGSHVVQEFAAQGHTVVGVDELTDYYDPELKKRNLDEISSCLADLHTVDVREAPLDRLLPGVDAVVHLAAQPGVRASWDHFDSYLEANLSTTNALLQACLRSGVRRIVVASSSSVYGDIANRGDLHGDHLTPESPYGVTKAAMERLCWAYARAQPISVAALRFFTVFGPRQRPDMAAQRIIEAGLDGSTFEIFGSGEQRRFFTFVKDVAEAVEISLRLDSSVPWYPLDVAGEFQHSLNDVIAEVERALGRTVSVERTGALVGDPADVRPRVSDAAPQLDWQPTTTLRDGIRQQVEWNQRRRSAV